MLLILYKHAKSRLLVMSSENVNLFFIHSTGMLRRWDDSQRFLADMPQLICDETANYLILWCMRLQQEEVSR